MDAVVCTLRDVALIVSYVLVIVGMLALVGIVTIAGIAANRTSKERKP